MVTNPRSAIERKPSGCTQMRVLCGIYDVQDDNRANMRVEIEKGYHKKKCLFREKFNIIFSKSKIFFSLN